MLPWIPMSSKLMGNHSRHGRSCGVGSLRKDRIGKEDGEQKVDRIWQSLIYIHLSVRHFPFLRFLDRRKLSSTARCTPRWHAVKE